MRRDDKNPPGPTPLPLVGSLLDFPLENHYVKFTKWREQYGEFLSLTYSIFLMKTFPLCRGYFLRERPGKANDDLKFLANLH
jgi:hypothetical protein